jgi:hypothetical protein
VAAHAPVLRRREQFPKQGRGIPSIHKKRKSETHSDTNNRLLRCTFNFTRFKLTAARSGKIPVFQTVLSLYARGPALFERAGYNRAIAQIQTKKNKKKNTPCGKMTKQVRKRLNTSEGRNRAACTTPLRAGIVTVLADEGDFVA